MITPVSAQMCSSVPLNVHQRNPFKQSMRINPQSSIKKNPIPNKIQAQRIQVLCSSQKIHHKESALDNTFASFPLRRPSSDREENSQRVGGHIHPMPPPPPLSPSSLFLFPPTHTQTKNQTTAASEFLLGIEQLNIILIINYTRFLIIYRLSTLCTFLRIRLK